MTVHPEDLLDLFAPRGADRVDVAELAALHAARSLELATGRGARGLVHIGDLSPAQTVLELFRLATLGQRLLDEAAERPRAALADAVAKAREADHLLLQRGRVSKGNEGDQLRRLHVCQDARS